MKEKVNIVKVGGAILDDNAMLDEMLRRFCSMHGPKILVHGGGRSATRLAAQLGIESRMVNGRRITDKSMLEIVTMVYGGSINKHIVASLQSMGVNAVGLTGADLNVIKSHKRPLKDGIDYGYVGDVDQVDGAMLHHLLSMGITPVMAPLTHDGQGHLLNTNADTIAAETAKSLVDYRDVTLTYCFEKQGVLSNPDDERSVIPLITHADFERLKSDGTISGGMIPKIENALNAIDAGVKEVVIVKAMDLWSDKGTIIK